MMLHPSHPETARSVFLKEFILSFLAILFLASSIWGTVSHLPLVGLLWLGIDGVLVWWGD